VLSSHILADVQEVCDTVGVMRAGRLLYQGSLDDLLVGHAVPAYRVTLRTPAPAVMEALRGCEWVTSVAEPSPGTLRLGVRSLADAETGLAGVLDRCGARVVRMAPEAPDLEDVFLELTS
jgi:ABC-2 type transport system ATP-binding protein